MTFNAIPINDFKRQRASKLNCMKYCNGCKQELTKTDTTSAHSTQLIIGGRIQTRFYCDTCKQIEDNEQKYLSNPI